MELIEQHLFPHAAKHLAVVVYAPYKSRRRQPFALVKSALEQSVVQFVARLRGVGALMFFKVKFTLVDGHTVALAPQPLVERPRGRGDDLAQTLDVRLAHDAFEMPFPGTAAAVAHAVGDERLFEVLALIVFEIRLHDRDGTARGIVIPLRRHVRHHFAAVYALPAEGAVRELVVLVPAELDGHEVLFAALFHDLRQRGGEAEHIGQPCEIGAHAEFLVEVLLPHRELSDQRLAGREIAVAFRPHPALYLYAPVVGGFLQPAEYLGLFLFHPLELLRLRRAEYVAGIALYVFERGREGAGGFSVRLAERPQPCKIQVRVPHRGVFVDRSAVRSVEPLFEHGGGDLSVPSPRGVAPSEQRIYLPRVGGSQVFVFPEGQKQLEKDEIVVVIPHGKIVAHRDDRLPEAHFLVLSRDIVEARVHHDIHTLAALRAV